MDDDAKMITILNGHRDFARVDLPSSIRDAGAAFAWDEFFAGVIRNHHTRTAYLQAVRKFLAWVEETETPLERISPGMVGAYFNQHPGSLPTKKLHLAALRAFFDVLVQRHVLILNPAATVRGERYAVIEGKTPEISRDQARDLLTSIDTTTPIGRRDKAIIATLIYTAARAGAIANLRLRDFVWDGSQYALRFLEKGGKSRAIPIRHDLQGYLLDYLNSFEWQTEKSETVLFRSGQGRTGQLTQRPLRNIDICRMVKRRLRDAGLPPHLSPHSFRVATVTDLLNQGIALEDVQYLAGHADPRTTRLYDRRQKQVTRNTVERISI
ncbi:Tyrosine recombinase XerC [Symmachiella dynata]|uniref:Tyrosine recombinase XerC n=1 Tax=Symmachiella dynata TaxID=2527995 RepID=A0A517ZRY2_9PLAN|nr:tyrosine-type recombinase/integrase [Symmachiella dynata]QDU45203.1 Tyrosine recombinase XerC [Symmachiella dynata]